MDAENKPAENVTEAASPPATLGVALPARNASHNDAGGRAGPAASDKSAARWRLILLVLCAVGAVLVIGILALQVTEYLFYKAPPNVWPQPGAGGMVSAPATFIAPVTATTAPSGVATSAVPVSAATTAASSAAVTSTVPMAVPTTSAPPETATSTVPVAAATVAAPSKAVTSSGVTSMPAVAATSAPAPAATMP